MPIRPLCRVLAVGDIVRDPLSGACFLAMRVREASFLPGKKGRGGRGQWGRDRGPHDEDERVGRALGIERTDQDVVRGLVGGLQKRGREFAI
jgi:hypothetical protein